MSDRIDKIRDAVETMHGCKAVHFASEMVVELYRGEVAWDGVVETFDLTGHPKAKRCHAWSYRETVALSSSPCLNCRPWIRQKQPSR